MCKRVVDCGLQAIRPAGDLGFLQTLRDASLRKGASHLFGDGPQQQWRYANSRNADATREFAALADRNDRNTGCSITARGPPACHVEKPIGGYLAGANPRSAESTLGLIVDRNSFQSKNLPERTTKPLKNGVLGSRLARYIGNLV